MLRVWSWERKHHGRLITAACGTECFCINSDDTNIYRFDKEFCYYFKHNPVCSHHVRLGSLGLRTKQLFLDQDVDGHHYTLFVLLQSSSALQNFDGVISDDTEDKRDQYIGQFDVYARGCAAHVGEDVSQGLPQAVIAEGCLGLPREDHAVECWRKGWHWA